MIDPRPDSATLPAARFWSARRRRPAFLFLLSAGLALSILGLPVAVRAAFWTAIIAQWGLLILLLLFALVTLSFIWSAGQRLDARVFQAVNLRTHPAWLDRVMWLVTQVGHMLTAFLAALVLFLLDFRGLATAIFLGTIGLWLLVETIKTLTDRPRPSIDLEGIRIIGWRERGRSFPSGHTAQTFFLTTLFSLTFRVGPAGTAGLLAVAMLVGFSRVYVGAHFPRDVIGGAVLGSVWGILVTLVDPQWFGWRI